MDITIKTRCRICGAPFSPVLDLGKICQSDFVDGANEPIPTPLCLVKCNKCDLVQLEHSVSLDAMYRQYWYRSSLNPSMVAALSDVVSGVLKRVALRPGNAVFDIGCNDATLLSLYPHYLIKVGFDPALNLKDIAESKCDVFVNNYYRSGLIPPFFSKMQPPMKAYAITTIAMFYDLDDPRAFVREVKAVLADDGIWVIQLTDLISMLKSNAFDNICHEHLEYYSLAVLINLLRSEGLDVFDVEYNSVNGGSIRAYVCWSGKRAPAPTVAAAVAEERSYLATYDNPFLAFSHRVKEIEEKINGFIMAAIGNKKTVAVLGASTKGNTLLQYFKLTSHQIAFAGEVNPDKFGKRTVATNIPIISEAEAVARHPDYFLVLPWHFKDTFKTKMADYLRKGGKLIFPCPHPHIVSIDGENTL